MAFFKNCMRACQSVWKKSPRTREAIQSTDRPAGWGACSRFLFFFKLSQHNCVVSTLRETIA
jgi:hypothetical protein